mmetsp:Transcript_53982/g.167522  ORF Transcript_53982/g.167522 Transcript_53982/m.167522 type:complete len:248 (-) Transcript_53982:100-843(-)|eukprot:CAMPEP_0175414634 /NCGR_PEP_ID=MMETSP0095-20121207/43765_1 /TAXON_ID=311494 /ORGANISM="Alexandrium monilatum, Strain CCMP3105" /LENGTH=247 /DNA_ID=CAMNT_0016713701 /DNA_START=52 /DNA_END=795 /DNA_ORIENTATION=+
MPLAALLASSADHEAHLASDVAAAATFGGPGRPRLSPAAFFATDGAKEMAGLGTEGKMTILVKAQPPKRGLLDELSGSCKLNLGKTMMPGTDQTVNAKDQTVDVAKAAECAKSGGETVLDGFFGKVLERGDPGGAGVELKGSTEVPLGSLSRKQLHAAQDSCHDFATVLLHRLGKPGAQEMHHAEHMLSTNDAAHVMRSYGRCLMELGEASSTAGCRLGMFQRGGGGETERLCKEAMGPEEKQCVAM